MRRFPNLLDQDDESGIWSVSELSIHIRELIESDPSLSKVELEGEISNFVRARSGHLYFTLKDEEAQIKCVMWRSAADRLLFSPEDGDSVILKGRVSVYEKGGNYQFYADRMKPAGKGDLAAAFEALKAALAEEGLFDSELKKPLPKLPKKIGIVTSLNAAGLQDILNVLRRRYPIGDVLIAPTLVQGTDAPPQIINALRWLDGRNDVDVILIARGGGSIEDLWAFNDEALAREIAAAETPIISGVGHEIDFTIADFVADVRAPTPSAAAELVAPDLAEFGLSLQGIQHGLKDRIDGILADHRYELDATIRTMKLVSPKRQLESYQQRFDMLVGQLEGVIAQTLERGRARLAVLDGRLRAVSPLATLARGYAIVKTANGQIVRTPEQLNAGDSIQIQVEHGRIDANVAAGSTSKGTTE